MRLFIGLIFVVLLGLGIAVDLKDVIVPPLVTTKNLPEVCLVFIQGADIKPEQYKPLAEAIQEQAKRSFKLWIGIPEFKGDMSNPLTMNAVIGRIQAEMSKLGMTTDTLVTAGHSQGGAMVQLWTAQNPERVAAQVLMGSFLTRAWKKDYIFNYDVPTLTIGGEMDGLARVTRMAEAFYTQLLDPTQPDDNKTKFPVTVIEGVSHMQFASGDIPSLVFKRDLRPEVSYDEAHKLIASDLVTFLEVRLLSSAVATKQLQQRLDATNTFVSPIIKGLQMEGYHNFRPPCLCPTDICDPMPNCTAFCPFTAQYSQQIMGSGLEGLSVKNSDSFHDVWETEPTVHLPKVLNSCNAAEGNCVLETTTITQGVYHTGEDLEIWKKHFDVPEMDSGFLPITAVELRTKMTSRQSLYTHAGVTNADFNALDGGGVRCGEINQFSWDWAKSSTASKTLERFTNYGQPYVIGSDVDVCPAGPCWIWEELHYNRTVSNDYVLLTSPQFSTATDFWLPKTAGFHYCKVLSPARAMEWMYVDGLRAKYSLQSGASQK